MVTLSSVDVWSCINLSYPLLPLLFMSNQSSYPSALPVLPFFFKTCVFFYWNPGKNGGGICVFVRFCDTKKAQNTIKQTRIRVAMAKKISKTQLPLYICIRQIIILLVWSQHAQKNILNEKTKLKVVEGDALTSFSEEAYQIDQNAL